MPKHGGRGGEPYLTQYQLQNTTAGVAIKG